MSGDRGRYSKVSRRIWNSASFKALTQPKICGAWLFFRLLTAPELANIPGVFQAWDAGLAKALKCSLKDFSKAFQELIDEELAVADWAVGLIWLPNAIAHNEPESPNVVVGWRAAWQELPDCALKDTAQASLKAWMQAKGEPWAAAFEKATAKASAKPMANQEQKQEQEQKQKQDRTATPPQRFPMSVSWNPKPETLANLEIGGIGKWAIPELVARHRAHFSATSGDLRTDEDWNQSCIKWAFRDWGNPNKRPKKPEPEAKKDDTGGYGKASEWST